METHDQVECNRIEKLDFTFLNCYLFFQFPMEYIFKFCCFFSVHSQTKNGELTEKKDQLVSFSIH